MGTLDDKVAIVTGGTSGIGARAAELFSAEGARVVISGRRTQEGETLVRSLGREASFMRTDVTVEADVEALVAFAVERYGRLDCFFTTAGDGGTPGGIAMLDWERFNHTIAVHVGGAVAGMKHAAPVMVAQGSGSIINTASIGGHVAGWTFLDYSAAKAAIIHLTPCAAAQRGEHGLPVQLLSPRASLTRHFPQDARIRP